MDTYIKKAFNDFQKILDEFITKPDNMVCLNLISKVLVDTYRKGNKVLICGNGGSMTDAMHFAEEMTGNFRKVRKALPAIAISDPAHITCVGNDFGFEEIFSRGVEAYGIKGDVLIVLSTSGNSENIVRAVKKATELEITSIGLLGKDGGKLKDHTRYSLIIPGDNSDRIQEIHMMILHMLIEMIERNLFPENY